MPYTSFMRFDFFAFVKSGKALHLPKWENRGEGSCKKVGLAPRKEGEEEGREASGEHFTSLI
jgi:hypothetical protein